ncbi:hypothetical protein AMATHDRAFT_48006 [Amanita thiersii Skay4041]|uniref:RING-type domain-containing protein n=1 Tax=Amanita thiersii Skay4041 TaxID=703135 RepID=A0A2A9NPN1_9AGAR|nr:hypothetical protein AMATHDRAFT_48006 [Amanita thiersii Skay4041]
MSHAECDVCLDTFPLKEFQLLTCGHAFCKDCTKRIKEGVRHPRCPLCRQRLTLAYVNLVPAKLTTVDRIVTGLNAMDKDTKLISVKNAADKLNKASQSMNGDDGMAAALIEAVNDFKERIIPLYSEVHEQRKMIETLTAAIIERDEQDMQLKGTISDLGIKLQDATRAQRSAEEKREQAMAIARQATDTLCGFREKNEFLEKRVNELIESTTLLTNQLELHKASARKHKSKIAALKQKVQKLEKHPKTDEVENQAPSEMPSLVVLPDPTVSPLEGANPQQRRHTEHLPTSRLLDSATHLDFEGMPRPGFSSNWKPGEPKGIKRIKLTHKTKSTANVDFPINLDKSSHPIGGVQLGPKRSIRTRNPLR